MINHDGLDTPVLKRVSPTWRTRARQPARIDSKPTGRRKWINQLEYFWVCLIASSLILGTLSNAQSSRPVVIAIRVITIMLDIDIIIRFFSVGRPYSSFFASGRNCFDMLVAAATTALLIPVVQRSEAYPWLAVCFLIRWYRVVLVFPRMKPLIVRKIFNNKRVPSSTRPLCYRQTYSATSLGYRT